MSSYFDAAGTPTPLSAWIHVYRLLLWIDATTGLAHCYESDKSQPGRQWYARSLAFHAWLAERFEVVPDQLVVSIDWLFKRVIQDVVRNVEDQRSVIAERTAKQRAPYSSLEMPQPGFDAEIALIIQEHLRPHLATEPSDEQWGELTERVRAYVKNENKRKNLVGEGFEDTLKTLIERLPYAEMLEVNTRCLIQEIPEFASPGTAAKEKRVDLVIVNRRTGKRTLVTAKWSVRSDREEQLASDFISYANLNRGAPFEYVFVTNEFDPARLVAACDRIYLNHSVFDRIVHINPDALLASYGEHLRESFAKVPQRLQSGRLISLATWLDSLTAG